MAPERRNRHDGLDMLGRAAIQPEGVFCL
jgi:hypothetical protein